MSSHDDFDFELPPGLEAGTYANSLTVSYSAHEFTLDFGVVHAEPGSARPAGTSSLVVSRLHIPLTLMFHVIQTLNAAMTGYELMWGEIRTPEQREGGATP